MTSPWMVALILGLLSSSIVSKKTKVKRDAKDYVNGGTWRIDGGQQTINWAPNQITPQGGANWGNTVVNQQGTGASPAGGTQQSSWSPGQDNTIGNAQTWGQIIVDPPRSQNTDRGVSNRQNPNNGHQSSWGQSTHTQQDAWGTRKQTNTQQSSWSSRKQGNSGWGQTDQRTARSNGNGVKRNQPGTWASPVTQPSVGSNSGPNVPRGNSQTLSNWGTNGGGQVRQNQRGGVTSPNDGTQNTWDATGGQPQHQTGNWGQGGVNTINQRVKSNWDQSTQIQGDPSWGPLAGSPASGPQNWGAPTGGNSAPSGGNWAPGGQVPQGSPQGTWGPSGGQTNPASGSWSSNTPQRNAQPGPWVQTNWAAGGGQNNIVVDQSSGSWGPNVGPGVGGSPGSVKTDQSSWGPGGQSGGQGNTAIDQSSASWGPPGGQGGNQGTIVNDQSSGNWGPGGSIDQSPGNRGPGGQVGGIPIDQSPGSWGPGGQGTYATPDYQDIQGGGGGGNRVTPSSQDGSSETPGGQGRGTWATQATQDGPSGGSRVTPSGQQPGDSWADGDQQPGAVDDQTLITGTPPTGTWDVSGGQPSQGPTWSSPGSQGGQDGTVLTTTIRVLDVTPGDGARGDASTETPMGFVRPTPQGNFKGSDFRGTHTEDTSQWKLEDSIPGTPGQDYPNHSTIPKTNFDCKEHSAPGYYGDVDAQCQVFHICQADGRKDSFLCPVGTVFNQQYFICDWWFNFNCMDTPTFYELNLSLYQSEPRTNGNIKGQTFRGTASTIPSLSTETKATQTATDPSLGPTIPTVGSSGDGGSIDPTRGGNVDPTRGGSWSSSGANGNQPLPQIPVDNGSASPGTQGSPRGGGGGSSWNSGDRGSSDDSSWSSPASGGPQDSWTAGQDGSARSTPGTPIIVSGQKTTGSQGGTWNIMSGSGPQDGSWSSHKGSWASSTGPQTGSWGGPSPNANPQGAWADNRNTGQQGNVGWSDPGPSPQNGAWSAGINVDQQPSWGDPNAQRNSWSSQQDIRTNIDGSNLQGNRWSDSVKTTDAWGNPSFNAQSGWRPNDFNAGSQGANWGTKSDISQNGGNINGVMMKRSGRGSWNKASDSRMRPYGNRNGHFLRQSKWNSNRNHQRQTRY